MVRVIGSLCCKIFEKGIKQGALVMVGQDVEGYGDVDVSHGGPHLADFVERNDVFGGGLEGLG